MAATASVLCMSVCIHVGAASHEYIAPITMGLVLGRIDAETPSHEVVATIDDVQIQCHGERASAEVKLCMDMLSCTRAHVTITPVATSARHQPAPGSAWPGLHAAV